MADSVPEAMVQQARMTKFQNWAADPTKGPLIPSLVQALNCTEVRKQKTAMTTLENQTREDKEELLQKIRTLTASHAEDFHRFQQGVNEAVEKQKATARRAEDIAASCSTIVTKMNTLQNAHSGLDTRLTTRLAEIESRLDSLESEETRREGEELMSLLERYRKLMRTIGSISHAELASLAEAFSLNGTASASDAETERTGNPGPSTADPLETFRTSIRRRHVVPLTPAASAQTVPAAVETLTRRWTEWARAYEKKRPKYEDAFVRSLLEAQNGVVAEFVQNAILQFCPQAKKCRPRQRGGNNGKGGIRLFLNPTSVSWPQVDTALQKMDYDALIQLVRMDEQEKLQNLDHLPEKWSPEESQNSSRQPDLLHSGWAGSEETEF